MPSFRLRPFLVAAALLLLSSCAYQYLDDDDPHGAHHTNAPTSPFLDKDQIESVQINSEIGGGPIAA